MIEFKVQDITVTRGDSGEISVTPLSGGEGAQPYFLKEGECVRFFVRLLPGGEPVIEKTLTLQGENGELTLHLLPCDTDIPRASYVYEAKLCSADGSEVCTFIGGGADKPRFVVT